MTGATVRYAVKFGGKPRNGPKNGPHFPAGASGAEPSATGTSRCQDAPVRPVARAARMLALAYFVERETEAGRIKDYAEAATRLGISKPRMAQVMALLNLAPATQEAVVTGNLQCTERRLRAAARDGNWESQPHS